MFLIKVVWSVLAGIIRKWNGIWANKFGGKSGEQIGKFYETGEKIKFEVIYQVRKIKRTGLLVVLSKPDDRLNSLMRWEHLYPKLIIWIFFVSIFLKNVEKTGFFLQNENNKIIHLDGIISLQYVSTTVKIQIPTFYHNFTPQLRSNSNIFELFK